MPHRIINTEADIADFTRFLGTLKLPLTVEWVQGRDRTKDQNSLQWLWANEVAQQFGDRDGHDVQAEWKLRLGVPILRRDSADFRANYDAIVKPLPEPAKLNLMNRKYFDFGVTSLMKVPQMIKYMDAVERWVRDIGLHVTPPDPELRKYQARYRKKEDA